MTLTHDSDHRAARARRPENNGLETRSQGKLARICIDINTWKTARDAPSMRTQQDLRKCRSASE